MVPPFEIAAELRLQFTTIALLVCIGYGRLRICVLIRMPINFTRQLVWIDRIKC